MEKPSSLGSPLPVFSLAGKQKPRGRHWQGRPHHRVSVREIALCCTSDSLPAGTGGEKSGSKQGADGPPLGGADTAFGLGEGDVSRTREEGRCTLSSAPLGTLFFSRQATVRGIPLP